MVLIPPSPPRRPRPGSSSKPSKPFDIDAKTTLALRRAFKSLSYLRTRPASAINVAHYAALRAERARQAPPPSPPRPRRRKKTTKENVPASSGMPTAPPSMPASTRAPRAPLVTTVAHAPWMRQPTSLPASPPVDGTFFVSTPTTRGSLTAGSRVPRAVPLVVKDLWIDGNEPPPRDPERTPHQECAVCKQVKSCPVISGCGHSHCYPCIRVALEYSFSCPSCRATMTAAPFRCWAEEQCIQHDHPDWNNTSRVTYDFDGLEFPRYM